MVITGDLHWHVWKRMATITESGFNSHLEEQMRVWYSMLGKCKKIKNKGSLLILGDLFHAPRDSVHKDVILLAREALYNAGDFFDSIYILPGNHDLHRDQDILELIDGIRNVTILRDPRWVEIDDCNCLVLPYIREGVYDLSTIKKDINPGKINLVLGHLDILGASTGAGIKLPNRYTKEDLRHDLFDFGFFGHYHRAQNIKGTNFYYVGSHTHHEFDGDTDDKSFIYFDPSKPAIKKIKLDGPKYYDLEVLNTEELEAFLNNYDDKNYYKIKYDPRYIKRSSFSLGHNVIVDSLNVFDTTSRLEIDTSESLEDLTIKYLDIVKFPEEVDINILKKMTKKIFKEVEEKLNA